jgi:PAP2 superfamily
MRMFSFMACFAIAAAALPARAADQPAPHLDTLKGLSPVVVLDHSSAGQTALHDNYVRTSEIQHGATGRPTLLSFAEQQQQALRDAFVPFPENTSNASNLADGLGSTLNAAYQSLTGGCTSPDDDTITPAVCRNISDHVKRVMIYAYATTSADSGAGKFLFANATVEGKTAVSDNEMAILKYLEGCSVVCKCTDVFGRAYGHPTGMPGADAYGNPRPFETEPDVVSFTGKDYFGVPSSSLGYLWGGTQALNNSPSFPSGHTTYGYTESLLLALLVPQRYPQMIARGAEYGNDRIILGAHYTMDVIGGRALALYDMAQLLANKKGYVSVSLYGVTIDDFRQAVVDARADVVKALEEKCGASIAECAARDDSRFADPAKNGDFYKSTQTYDLATVYSNVAGDTEDVNKLAPEAGYLLTTAFPYLTLKRANEILTETEGPGGGFLDNGSAFGVYSRLDLYRAAEEAIKEGPPAKDRH